MCQCGCVSVACEAGRGRQRLWFVLQPAALLLLGSMFHKRHAQFWRCLGHPDICPIKERKMSFCVAAVAIGKNEFSGPE